MKTNLELKNFLTKIFLLFFVFAIGCSQQTEQIQTNMEDGFKNPPATAKPRVWWHWMNGNITKDGIKKDLDWMNRTGIGGFQNFDAAFNTPQIVEKRLTYMTPEWKDAFSFTTNLADSLGLEMAIAGSPGWSESGGPWVPAAEGMKKMVWSELTIEGGKEFSGELPHPPTTSGVFQNLGSNAMPSMSGEDYEQIPDFYEDAAVLAYRVPENDLSLKELNVKVTSSGGDFTLEKLTDGDLMNNMFLPVEPDGPKSWVQFEFPKAQTISSITMVGGSQSGGFGRRGPQESKKLEVSDDGKSFREVVNISSGGVAQNTITFSPATGKYFRVSVKKPMAQNIPGLSSLVFGNQSPSRGPSGINIAEIVLHTVPRINRFEEKAGFAVATNVGENLTPVIDAADAILKDQIFDLTDKLAEDGTISWTPPAGKWNIVRMGYSLTGRENHPASPEATGPEVDKLNPEYVNKYFNNYLDQYTDATGGLIGKKGLQYIITDSWEAGCSNWTDKMIDEFNARNSYNILPWLPVLTGKIVESSEASEKFLYDYRNTLEEMLAEYHYDELTKILNERGMGRYTESHENGRAFIGDGMEVKRTAAIPMSATWTPTTMPGMDPDVVMIRHAADIRESASVAHIYGQNINAAESFTAIGNSWSFDPAKLKPTADFMLSNGLNRFVIHTSVHQPLDDKIPGLGLGPFGQWFTRHETWAEQAKPWIDYLARSSYMLQQGKFVADIIYVYGQGSNITSLFGSQLPAIPEGYNYDFLNAGAVPKVLAVNNGQLITETGMEYKLLVLDKSAVYMTLPVLKKIQELVNNGATVVGPKPISSPSLNDDDAEFQAIANSIWPSDKGTNEIGKGKVYVGFSVEEVLNSLNMAPDVKYSQVAQGSKMRFVHRNLEEQELYWVGTTAKEQSTPKISFNIEGLEPEIWNPVTGEISKVAYEMSDGRTEISLNMDPEDALFVLFRNKTKVETLKLPAKIEAPLTTISGDWKVQFQEDRGAPDSAVFNELTPWNENDDQGIKYFSGTAEYIKNIDVPEEWISGEEDICLDLGEVKNLAEITVNGKPLGIVWKKPFQISVKGALKVGENNLSIKVTNLWVNRLIGDQQPGVTEKITYTTQAFYQAESPLLTSGLLGPVQLIKMQ